MEYERGQSVELTQAGRKNLTAQRGKERTRGEVLGKASKYLDCWRVKWHNRISPEVIHKSFIRPIVA